MLETVSSDVNSNGESFPARIVSRQILFLTAGRRKPFLHAFTRVLTWVRNVCSSQVSFLPECEC
jgi:hypothetical protein